MKWVRLLAAVCFFVSSPALAQVEWNRHGQVERFETLEEAISALKATPGTTGGAVPAEGVTIHLLPGKYRLSGTVVLGPAESGKEGALVALIGPADKSAVISGGRILQGALKVRDPLVLERLPRLARKSVVQFDLRREGINEFGPPIRRGFWPDSKAVAGQLELFFRGKPMTPARWPNEGYATLQAAPKGPDEGRSFRVNGLDAKRLAMEPDVMATGYWAEDWASETIPVESIDSQTGKITLQSPGPQRGIKTGQRVFLQNALSELDRPGEWYLDRNAGILYFWPPAPIRKGDVEVSVLPSLIATTGTSNVRITGVTFEMAQGDALTINGGSNVQVDHATIRNVGGRAANVEGVGHKFVDIDVYDTGEGGIYLAGGDRQTLRPANLLVEYCRIRRFNRLSRTYRPAIQLSGVGNRAIGNVISDGTHNAIMFFGNDHLIAFNEISEVALETGDVGAIYTGEDWTARGTTIRDNYLHDIHGPGFNGSRGIYLDDQASGIVVKGNLFVRVDRPIYVGGGRDNLVEDNVLVSSSPAIHVDARGLTWQRALTEDPQGAFRKRLSEIPFDRPPYRDRYPHLASILGDDPGAPKYNVIRDNLVVDGEAVQLTDGADRWVKVDSTIEANATLFKAGISALAGKRPGDFVIPEASPALRSGLVPLPLDAMDCVSARWRQIDAGRAPPACHVN